MTEGNGDWSGSDESRLTRLMRTMPRGAPDPAARARAFDMAHAEWRRLQGQRARMRRARWAAAASVAVVALAGALWLQPFAPRIASLDRQYGSVTLDREPLATGARLRRGAAVETSGASGALLRYSPDLTLRLDAGTRVVLVDAGNLQLESGRVYVAVAPGAAVPYVVHTAAGDVRHLGTHYAVRARGAALDVAVRDGVVQVDTDAGEARAGAGEALHVDAQGRIGRTAIAGDAPWAWVAKLPAPIVIEGKSLAEFLRWYATETGRNIVYADERTRTRAAAAILHGSVDGLPPAEALAIVVASVDLRAEVSADGPLTIGPAPH